MSSPIVYVNGQNAGTWAYGYNSFFLDVTEFVTSENVVLAVRCEVLSESTRWYPGAGIYRNVHVIVTESVFIPIWGNVITTPSVSTGTAQVSITTPVEGITGSPTSYSLLTQILDGSGAVVVEVTTALAQSDNSTFNQQLAIRTPRLWSPSNPALYTAVSRLYAGETLKDEISTRFGVRSIEVLPDRGFYLNGVKTMLKGVCLHHDLGPLGAAISLPAIQRQLRILKEMGCNAIRTSHNMPAPELVSACDELGFMVMAESFDEWASAKRRNGYNLYYTKWYERDLENLVRHYRNSASVVMWSIGNEIPEQTSSSGPKMAQSMQDICHREDPTRPVTTGMDKIQQTLSNGFGAVLDIAGLNYRLSVYEPAYRALPQKLILGSETASTVSSRGVFKFPVSAKAGATYSDRQCSGYDVEYCSWSNLPDDDWVQQEDMPYVIGEFVWTGFDYLGEPTPYGGSWPSHGSYFGIVDLAGIPKDRYYLYRSHWNTAADTLHIVPHWTWPGRENQTTPVYVYTSAHSAELFVNGASQGRREKNLTVAINSSDHRARYRLMWDAVVYRPGSLRVVAYNANGQQAGDAEVMTAGAAHHIVVSADRVNLTADGKDLAFILVKIVDADGTLCPAAANLVEFSVTGRGAFKAAANGDSTSLDLFQDPRMHAFAGQLTAIVQTTEQAGSIVFTASAEGLVSGSVTLTSV